MSESKPKTAQDLYEAFLELSEADQHKLLLLISKNSEWVSDEIEQAWVNEARRRLELFESGNATTIPADEAINQARQRFSSLNK